MAGDINIHEQSIVLSVGASSRGAGAQVAQMRSQVIHSYGSRVIIAALEPGMEGEVQAHIPGAEVAFSPDSISEDAKANLDMAERLGLNAFALRQSDRYMEAKANRPYAGADWDSGVAEIPACHDLGVTEAEARELLAQAPTSSRLTGSVAVGLIIVEGPTTALKFSSAERTKVVAEVQNGLGWLGSQSPDGVSWYYDIQVVTLSVNPGPGSLSSSEKETLWRDPAMAKLGYGSGLNGVRDYVDDIRSRLNTTWGYCAFFTKYPLGHFAYASIGGPRLVMDYRNDGWGPDNIDRVFAHETGHIFGAPDEYAASGCGCGGTWGFYGEPNGNCANCAPDGGVPCLMKSNSWEMCTFTPYHLGFPLVEQRYSGVWRQGSDSHYLWVNASWTSFRNKWQELAGQNLRLVDLEISGPSNAPRYHGVWRQGSGSYYLWVNASWTSFRNKWQELAGQNLRLIDIEVRVVNGQLRYSGVWLPGNDSYYLWVNASWTSFRNKWQELAGQNLRLIDLKIVQINGTTRYFGVWRRVTGAYYLWVNATWNSFVDKWQELAGQGLRLVDLEVTNFDGNRRYSGVWLPGSDGYALWGNANWQSFRNKWEELAGQNLRLIDLEVSAPGDLTGSPRIAAISGVEVDNIQPQRTDTGGMADETIIPEEAFAYSHSTTDASGHGDGDGGGQISASTTHTTLTDGEGGGAFDDRLDFTSISGTGGADGYGGGQIETAPVGVRANDDGFGGGDVGGTGAVESINPTASDLGDNGVASLVRTLS